MNTYLAIITVLQAALLAALIIVTQRARRLRALESQYSPFWREFQREIMVALHHPHPESYRMDELMEKLNNLTITPDETNELKALATAKADDPQQAPRERQLAEFLIFAMPRVIREARQQPGGPTIDMSPSVIVNEQ